jgi:hypothetical protein
MPTPTGVSRQQRLAEEAQFFQSPWSEQTEKLRNQVLLVSLAGILMAAVGIFPKEITALGLRIGDINQKALLVLWAIIDAYLTICLAFHAYSDFMRLYWSELNAREMITFPTDEAAKRAVLQQMKLKARLMNIHFMRLFIDMIVPLVSGIAAFCWLVWRCFRPTS